MATIRQKKAFAKVVENGGNVSRAMIDVGYSPQTAKSPKKLTTSNAWNELCEKYGLTDDLLVKALVADIKKKKGNRKAELELGFKVKGKLKDNDGGEKQQFNFFFSGDQSKRIARRILSDSPQGEE